MARKIVRIVFQFGMKFGHSLVITRFLVVAQVGEAEIVVHA